MVGVFRKKSIEASIAASEEPGHQLKRSLGAWNLVLMSVGVVVGAGIFSKAAAVSSSQTGPAVIISFIIAAVVCGLAALCYAEFASHIPVAGSAYTFSYTSMGEIVAWIIGWDLILEMGLAAAMVAKYWGIYLDQLFQLLGWQHVSADGAISGVHNSLIIGSQDFAPFNLLFIAILAVLLIVGTKLSANVTSVLTVVKICVALIVIVAGFLYFKAENFQPFIPPAVSGQAGHFSWTQTLFSVMTGQGSSAFGVYGILAGAGTVFFAFIGFDVIATAAEETKNPKRNVPLGIFGGLAACASLYILMSIALSGMAKPGQLAAHACQTAGGQIGSLNAAGHFVASTLPSSNAALGTLDCYTGIAAGHPVSQGQAGQLATIIDAFGVTGHSGVWLRDLITIGILIGLTTVVMVVFLGCIRIVFAMSRDGLFPRALSKTSKRFGTPVLTTLIMFVLIGLATTLLPVDVLGNMINIGTLSAFVLVSFGVPILRRRRRNAPGTIEGYNVPFSPVLPIVSGVACIWLTLQLDVETWLRFVIWLVIGLVIYFAYGFRHSRLRRHPEDIAVDYSHALSQTVVPDTK